MPIDRPEEFFGSVLELELWLEQNQESSGIWAVYFKKSTGQSDLNWESLVESCLCFGWIDSLPGKVDEQKTKTYISPRKPGSGWSRRNQILIAELQSRGRLRPRGLAVLEKAKADGSWQLFDRAEDLVLSDNLKRALASNKALEASWQRLSESKRRQKLQFLYSAKTEATEKKRIAELLEELAQS